MRRSKGYTDELEKINRDDSGLAITTGLKEVTPKKLKLWIMGYSQGEFGIYYETKDTLCYTKITTYLKQRNLKTKT